MQKMLAGCAGFLAIVAAIPAHAQQPIKIGIILAYSGQFADPSAQMDNGVKLYMKQHGETVAGRKIELIRKDTGGIAPDIAKRLAQELATASTCSRDLRLRRMRSQRATCRRRRKNSWST